MLKLLSQIVWDSGCVISIKNALIPVYSAVYTWREFTRFGDAILLDYRLFYIFGIRVYKYQIKK